MSHRNAPPLPISHPTNEVKKRKKEKERKNSKLPYLQPTTTKALSPPLLPITIHQSTQRPNHTMAKTPKPKPNPTPRSRAAKRALPSSPTTTIPRPDEKPANEKLAALSARTAGSSGVQKRKGGKALSRQKRRRKEAAMDKAGAVLEKLERRREVSVRKGGVVKGRSVSIFPLL